MVSEKQNQTRRGRYIEKRRKGMLIAFSILTDILTNSSKCNNKQNHLAVRKEASF